MKYIQIEGGQSPGAPYIGAPPTHCELCGQKLNPCFVDGRTTRGPWANMCLPCHDRYGVGLGVGKGQKYCQET